MGHNNIRAISWDSDFKDFIHNSSSLGHVRVHTVFKKVVNIVDDKDRIYTISNIYTDNAPSSLKVDFKGTFKDIILNYDRIKISKEAIIIGNIRINLHETKLWLPYIKKINDDSRININKSLAFFNEYLVSMGQEGGCKSYYLKHFLNITVDKLNPIEEQIEIKLGNFYRGLLSNSLSEDSIKDLIGLGIGLTPSGDDFLTGFLASIKRSEKEEDLHKKIGTWILPLLASTTDISGAMLRAGIEGKYREGIHNFINSFLQDDKDVFIRSFDEILKLGSSSGTDLSIGIALGFHYINTHE